MRICYDVKRKLWAWMAAVVLLVSSGTVPMEAYAAEIGTTVDNPVNIVFDRIYSKSWTKDTDHLYCYNKIVLPEQGIVTMNFSKPYDSEGEYGRLNIKIYDSRQNLVWDTNSWYSKESASSNYSFNVGLAKGEYYVLVKPAFYVISGNITTKYSFSFTPTEYCEVEPNEAASSATLMKPNGMFYQGYIGEGDEVEDADFFKINLTAGEKYKMTFDNFSAIKASTVLLYIYDSNSKYSIRNNFNKVDSNGYDYCEFTAAETGIHYLVINNYGRRQMSYKVSIDIFCRDGHTYDDGVITKPPTMSENGIKTYTCKVCGATRTEPLDKLSTEIGMTVDNPVMIEFGKDYSTSWKKDTDDYYFYNKIVLDAQGIVNMNFSKPDYSDGALEIKVYDSTQRLVWDTDCRLSKKSVASIYHLGVGLAKGEYFVLVKPGFSVGSGSIVSTNYNFAFTPTEYCEVEANETAGSATLIKTDGSFYQGYFGEGDDTEKSDFFKFELTAGRMYKISMENFSAISNSGYLRLYDPSGNEKYVQRNFNGVDGNGYDYFEYEAKQTGVYYLELLGYSITHTSYKIAVDLFCKEHIYNEGVITVEPTFTEPGTKTYTCTVCGATRVEQLDKLKSFGWVNGGDKSYWYEDAIKQGTYNDAKGVLGDGVVRGREIYDPDSDGWYWLDACYDGAKACSKEVWMPYIYQDEENWSEQEIRDVAYASGDMANQVVAAIHEGTGKWVRYDADGKMYKGWYTVSYSEAALYPSQVGNTYYYDPITGLMAKGYVIIGGRTYHFNEVTGVMD